MTKLLIIAIGGAIGAVLRYAVSGLPYKYFDAVFPYGTMLVNLSGAYIIGILFAFSERVEIPTEWRLFVFIGILGAYTTFSTFALESSNLIRDREFLYALWNFLVTNIGGVALVFLGFITTRAFFRLFVLFKGR